MADLAERIGRVGAKMGSLAARASTKMADLAARASPSPNGCARKYQGDNLAVLMKAVNAASGFDGSVYSVEAVLQRHFPASDLVSSYERNDFTDRVHAIGREICSAKWYANCLERGIPIPTSPVIGAAEQLMHAISGAERLGADISMHMYALMRESFPAEELDRAVYGHFIPVLGRLASEAQDNPVQKLRFYHHKRIADIVLNALAENRPAAAEYRSSVAGYIEIVGKE